MSARLIALGVGSTIKEIRWMTDEEMEKEGWGARNRSGNGVVLEMVGGGKIYASRDDEGNGPGALFGETAGGKSIYVAPDGSPPETKDGRCKNK